MTSSTDTPPDYYRLLGISPDATLEVIRAAYRGKLHHSHPDLVANKTEDVRHAATEMTALLNVAYECLSDPDRRAAYDTGSRAGTASSRREPTSSSGRHRARSSNHRVRDIAAISLGGIVLPLLMLAWASGLLPLQTPANPRLVAAVGAGAIAATVWLLTSSRLLRQPDRLARIGVVWGRLMRWSGWILVSGCAVLFLIPAAVMTLMAVIAIPFLGLVIIALISGRSDSQNR